VPPLLKKRVLMRRQALLKSGSLKGPLHGSDDRAGVIGAHITLVGSNARAPIRQMRGESFSPLGGPTCVVVPPCMAVG